MTLILTDSAFSSFSLFFFLCFTISSDAGGSETFFLLGCLGFFRRQLWLNMVIWVLKDGFVMGGKGKERDFVFLFFFKLYLFCFDFKLM